MFKTTTYSYVVAILLALTCVSHTVGTFMEIPKEQIAVRAGYEVMQRTVVPMPFGVERMYSEIFLGTNLAVSLFLLFMTVVFVLLAKDVVSNNEFKILVACIIVVGLLAVISFRYFFPLPGALLGSACIFGIVFAFQLQRRGSQIASK